MQCLLHTSKSLIAGIDGPKTVIVGEFLKHNIQLKLQYKYKHQTFRPFLSLYKQNTYNINLNLLVTLFTYSRFSNIVSLFRISTQQYVFNSNSVITLNIKPYRDKMKLFTSFVYWSNSHSDFYLRLVIHIF